MTFSKEYKDARWKPCRYGTDLRTCGQGYKERMSNTIPDYPNCRRDGKKCDAEWTGPIDK